MTDERLELLLKNSFVTSKPGVELQEKLLQRLYAQEQGTSGRQRGAGHNLRRRILSAACGLAVLLVTGCAAVGIVKHYHATETVTRYENYGDLQQAAKDLGKSFAAVETFSDGFSFQGATLMNTEALDDAGAKLFGGWCLELIYKKGTYTIAIGLEPSETSEKVAHKSFEKLMEEVQVDEQYHVTELEPVDGIPLYYESIAIKYVPEGYQLTSYDKSSIEAGRYEIAYGAERQYMRCRNRIMWEMDGVIYCIVSSYMDKYGEEELGQMAAEIIAQR